MSMTAAPKLELLNDLQVEAEYGFPRATLQTWRCRKIGGPPFIRVTRGCIKYKRADIDQFLEDRKVTPMQKSQ